MSVIAAGLEVGSRELVLCLGEVLQRFTNDREGHGKLLRFLHKRGSVRVCLEATGNYHLDVALTLSGRPGIQVQILNPWSARRFAEAQLRRAKTDRVDAKALRQYAMSMPHQEWTAPSKTKLALRAMTRRMQHLTERKTAESNQRHALLASEALPEAVVASISETVEHLDEQICGLQAAALALVRSEEQLERHFELLLTLPGVAERTALYILGELEPLNGDMKARQLVAHAGLDPRAVESGSSVHKPRHISKRGNARIRHILFMPALVAVVHDPYFRALYERLIERQLAKKAALVAAMRKLLHAIHGVWTSNQPFDGARLVASLAKGPEASHQDGSTKGVAVCGGEEPAGSAA